LKFYLLSDSATYTGTMRRKQTDAKCNPDDNTSPLFHPQPPLSEKYNKLL